MFRSVGQAEITTGVSALTSKMILHPDENKTTERKIMELQVQIEMMNVLNTKEEIGYDSHTDT